MSVLLNLNEYVMVTRTIDIFVILMIMQFVNRIWERQIVNSLFFVKLTLVSSMYSMTNTNIIIIWKKGLISGKYRTSFSIVYVEISQFFILNCSLCWSFKPITQTFPRHWHRMTVRAVTTRISIPAANWIRPTNDSFIILRISQQSKTVL